MAVNCSVTVERESPASKPKGNDIPGAIAEGFQTMTIPPVLERVVCDPAEYITGRKLSKCSSGKVYVGRLIDMPGGAYNGRNAHEVVLKFEHRKSRAGCYDAPLEWTLNGCYGIPSVHYMGRQGDYHILVMDMLGPNLWDVRDSLEQKKMPFQMVARIAVEAISIIEKIHSKGFVHGDVKPENLLLGQPGSAQENKLFLINFGLASNWKWERGSSNWKWFFTCPRRPLAPPHRSPPPYRRRPPCRPGPRVPPLQRTPRLRPCPSSPRTPRHRPRPSFPADAPPRAPHLPATAEPPFFLSSVRRSCPAGLSSPRTPAMPSEKSDMAHMLSACCCLHLKMICSRAGGVLTQSLKNPMILASRRRRTVGVNSGENSDGRRPTPSMRRCPILLRVRVRQQGTTPFLFMHQPTQVPPSLLP